MKIKNIQASMDFKGDILLTFSLEKSEKQAVQELLNISKENIPKYDLKVEKRKKKRSLEANAYCWKLCDEIAKVLGSTKDEIYQSMITMYGVHKIDVIREDVVDYWIEFYNRQGKGDFAEDMGECKTIKGFHNVMRYYGSSGYDTKQMARLIDGIVYECKDLGIETLPPDEIAELKSKWGG